MIFYMHFRKKEILPKQRKRDKRSESKNKKHKSRRESPTPDTGTFLITLHGAEFTCSLQKWLGSLFLNRCNKYVYFVFQSNSCYKFKRLHFTNCLTCT